MKKKQLTPLLRQYLEIKEEYKECLIFFRLGDFYELFFQDAEIAAKELNITLTKRGQINGKDIPMCGVPFFQGETYLARLLKKGFKVAICEQMERPEDSKKRGHKEIIKRKVVRIATPGTLTEEKELESPENNYLASIICIEKIFCLGWIDISTGEINLKNCRDRDNITSTIDEVGPSEIIYSSEYLDKEFLRGLQRNFSFTLTKVASSYFDQKKNANLINSSFASQKSFSTEELTTLNLKLLGSLMKYISYTQDGKIPPVKLPNKEEEKKLLEIDASSRKNLEIISTLNGTRKGSLLDAVDYTKTSGGARKLINDLIYPLADMNKILVRQEIIEFFFNNYNIFKNTVSEQLARIPDFSRSIVRLSLNRGGPRDLSSILKGLERIFLLCDIIFEKKEVEIQSKATKKLIEPIIKNKNLKYIKEKLDNALEETLPQHSREGGFIKKGYNSELDDIRDYRDDSKKVILEVEMKEKSLTKINSLKVKYNNFLGYFIEVSPMYQKNIKDNQERYIHRQTLKNCIRYSSKELIDVSEKIINCNANLLEKELKIYKKLVNVVKDNSQILLKASDIVARIDVAFSWANYAKNTKSIKPIISDSNDYAIDNGRHPSVEKTHTQEFIPNSCILNNHNNNIFKLITGPNMSGKSTFLRQNAIILIMAQAGGFCPADKVKIGICDKLFCRVGSGDELAKGNSTFMVEMLETARILQNATDRSMVILDEIGRGTSTYDGMSIAWATIEYLIENIKCKALFATHYNELGVLKNKFKELELNTFRVKEWKDDLVFLHEIMDGVAESSYGIQVAKMAGIPKKITKRAEKILIALEKENHKKKNNNSQLNINYSKEINITDSLLKQIKEEINQINIDSISPLDALNILNSYKRKIEEQKKQEEENE